MSKPSIFSKDYEKHMKKRKRNMLIMIIILIIAILCMCLYLKDGSYSFSKMYNNIISKINQFNKEKKLEVDVSNEDNRYNNSEHQTNKDNEKGILQNDKSQDKFFYVNINNRNIQISYEEKNEKRTLKQAKDLDNNYIYYDINPSKNGIIIYDSNSQEVFYIDVYGNISNITKQKYISTKGDEFNREEVLKNNENYIWCTTPKFLNDDTIAFISELPWINKDNNKYIWYGSIKDRKYRYIKSNISKDIRFSELTNEGLKVIIDKKQYILMDNGQLIQSNNESNM